MKLRVLRMRNKSVNDQRSAIAYSILVWCIIAFVTESIMSTGSMILWFLLCCFVQFFLVSNFLNWWLFFFFWPKMVIIDHIHMHRMVMILSRPFRRENYNISLHCFLLSLSVRFNIEFGTEDKHFWLLLNSMYERQTKMNNCIIEHKEKGEIAIYGW